MLDPILWCLVAVILAILSALLWMTWLYVMTYRQLVTANRDRDRLIRRIGVYHGLPLITPYENMPKAEIETPLPPPFSMKKPVPPPGWHSKG